MAISRGDGSLLDVAAKAASFNVILQIGLRVSSFVLNGFVLRYVQAELLGVVNLRLTLLYNTVLFLSREPLRKAALSRASDDRHWGLIFNLMWLALPVGVACGSLLSLLWVSPLLQQPEIPWDWVGVVMFFVAALIELLAEPLWVLAQGCQHVSIKVVAEGISQVVRCIIIAVGVVLFPNQYGVVIFASGQLVYSILCTSIYYLYFLVVTSQDGHNLPINSITGVLPSTHLGSFQSTVLLNLSWSFFKQSLLKQLLTDGERYIMTILGVLTFAEQGVYDIVNNLGSLVARFLFLPIEESFYVFFAHLLLRGEKSLDQKRHSVVTSSNTLSLLLKLVSIVGIVIFVFGFNFSYLALDLYGGVVLSQGIGPLLLRWYCVYVMFLAINGITECFMFAVMSHQLINRYNRAMLVFSGVFLVAAFLLTRLFGSVGFILANCVNMAIRIYHSSSFIHTFFSPVSLHPLSSSIPSLALFGTSALVFAVMRVSELNYCCEFGLTYRLVHIGVGCVSLIAVGLVTLFTEQKLCSFLVERLPNRLQRIVHTLFPRTVLKHN